MTQMGLVIRTVAAPIQTNSLATAATMIKWDVCKQDASLKGVLTCNGSRRHGLEGAHLGLVDDTLGELIKVVVAVVGKGDAKESAVQAALCTSMYE